jgi:ATP-dependent Clp protease, protease subunit
MKKPKTPPSRRRTKVVYRGQQGHVVTLAGVINQACVRKLARLFETVEGPITIMLSTPGGDLDAAMAMHELIRLRVDAGGVVMTIGAGAVMSAAVLILCAGTKGYRCMTRFSRMLYHESSTSIQGNVSKLRNELQALEDTDSDFDTLVAQYTGRKVEQVRKLYAKGDNWMSATQALRFGFVDKLI